MRGGFLRAIETQGAAGTGGEFGGRNFQREGEFSAKRGGGKLVGMQQAQQAEPLEGLGAEELLGSRRDATDHIHDFYVDRWSAYGKTI